MADAPTLPFLEGRVLTVLTHGGTYQLVCFSSRNGNAINHFTKVQLRRYFSHHFTLEGFEELAFVEHHTGTQRHMYSLVMHKE